LQVVGGDAEQLFTGYTALASMLSEGVIFAFLVGMILLMNPSLALIV